MKTIVTLASVAVIGLAACATGGGDPSSVAARECGYFARAEGAHVVGVEGVEAVGDGFKVRLKVEDALARRANAECLYSANKASWAAPLPNGFAKI